MVKVFVSTDAVFGPDVSGRFFAMLSGGRWLAMHDVVGDEDNHVKAFFRRGVENIAGADGRAVEDFWQRCEVAAGFPRLVQFCSARGLDIYCVGEGLDLYMQLVLASHEASTVRLLTNHVEHTSTPSNGWCVGFPYDDAECTRCACCVRNLMLTLSGDSDRIVFIGCTERDACPAAYADIVFAKDTLQACCQRRNISYFLYESFDDVAQRLAQLLDAKPIKARREAAMRRRAAFVAE